MENLHKLPISRIWWGSSLLGNITVPEISSMAILTVPFSIVKVWYEKIFLPYEFYRKFEKIEKVPFFKFFSLLYFVSCLKLKLTVHSFKAWLK